MNRALERFQRVQYVGGFLAALVCFRVRERSWQRDFDRYSRFQ